MTIPVWVLLGFALWTLLVLATLVAGYRWGRILRGRANFATFGEYRIEGADWYRRGMRAHANCVEYLPVYGAIVVVILAAGLDTAALDGLALVFLGARILHTLVHVLFPQTNTAVAFRSGFTHVEVVCMVAMAGVVIAEVGL